MTKEVHAKIILYAYDFAPNCQKVIRFLKLFRIPHTYVVIPQIQPRPDFAAVDISYRRAPLLSIDGDLYADTSLIIEKLLDMAGHLELYPGDCTNYIAYDAVSSALFPLAAGLLPRDHPNLNDPAFVRDRQLMHSGKQSDFDPDAIAASRPKTLAQFCAWLYRIEAELGDREYLLGGDLPSTADFYTWYLVDWCLRDHKGALPEVSRERFPVIWGWCDRIHALLDGGVVTSGTWDDARQTLLSPSTKEYAKFVPHDAQNVQGLHPGDRVQVTPRESGRVAQHGSLLSMSKRQLCLRNDSGIVMHFPLAGYDVERARSESS